MRAAKSPLVLNLKPSKSLLVFQLLMAATAIVHLTLLPIETWPRLLALVLVVAWAAALAAQSTTDNVLLPQLRSLANRWRFVAATRAQSVCDPRSGDTLL